jgi:hypothetical protein
MRVPALDSEKIRDGGARDRLSRTMPAAKKSSATSVGAPSVSHRT